MDNSRESSNQSDQPSALNDEPSGSSGAVRPKLPLCILITGMAGTGKTTFMHRLSQYLTQDSKKSIYNINLDPAVMHVPYPVNLDIRDTVKYKEVMQQFGLGPNGAIITCLNIFSTKIHEMMALLEKRAASLDYVLIDTPGQIEVFYWSASGTVITDCLAAVFPTTVVYVMDTPLCHNPNTFMSNMLYACGILYKYKLPFVLAMNKIDIIDCSFAKEWMEDFDAFDKAFREMSNSASSTSNNVGVCSAAFSNLSYSLSLVLDTFYAGLRSCGVSAFSGEGLAEFETLCLQARDEYWTVYRAHADEVRRKILQEKQKKNDASNPVAMDTSGSQIHTEPLHRPVVLGEEEDETPGGSRNEDDEDILDDANFRRISTKVKSTHASGDDDEM